MDQPQATKGGEDVDGTKLIAPEFQQPYSPATLLGRLFSGGELNSIQQLQRDRRKFFLQNLPHLQVPYKAGTVSRPKQQELEIPHLSENTDLHDFQKPQVICPLDQPDDKDSMQQCPASVGRNTSSEDGKRGPVEVSASDKGEEQYHLKPQPPRRLKGNDGEEVELIVNHFPVSFSEEGTSIVHYRVRLDPPRASKEVKRRMKTLLQEKYFKELIAYDGHRNLYIAEKTNLKCREFDSHEVHEFDVCPRSGGKIYRMTLTRVGILRDYDLKNFLRGQTEELPRDYLQALDTATRDSASWLYYVVNKSFYYDEGAVELEMDTQPLWNKSSSIWALRGFYHSLCPVACGLTLSLDNSAMPFHARKCVIHYLEGRGIDPRTLVNYPKNYRRAKEALAGLYVDVTHGTTSRQYKIVGISKRLAIQCMLFDIDSQEETNVVDYFQTKYHPIELDPYLPCLIVIRGHNIPTINQVGKKVKNADDSAHIEAIKNADGIARIEAIKPCPRCKYLPMDMSLIARGQKYTDRVSHTSKNTLRSMVGDTAEQRSKNIKETFSLVRSLLQGGARDIDDNTIRPVRPFGIEIGEKMIAVTGRLIRQPNLMLNVTNYSRGKWSLQAVHACPRNLRPAQWDVLVISPGKMLCSADVRRMMEYIFDRCNQMNIRCFREAHNQKTYKLWINSTDLERYDRLQRSLFNLQKEHDLQNLVFLFCIIEGTVRESCYGNLKRLCETRFGWLTQCCLKRHLDRRYKLYLTPIPPEDIPPNDPYFGNIALRVNAKLGGTNTALDEWDFLNSIFEDDGQVIILGIYVISDSMDFYTQDYVRNYLDDEVDQIYADDTHVIFNRESQRGIRRPSCTSSALAAVVGSMEWPNVYQYCARVRSHCENTELIGSISRMVLQLLSVHIFRNNGRKPCRAIFFIDGTSDSEFLNLLNAEINKLKQTLESECGVVKITWVVVDTGHSTRCFGKKGEKICEVEAGTVVDTDIVHPSQFDFYLAGESTGDGSVGPTYYHVLYDENNFTADGMQKLAFYLSHTSAIHTRTTAVVPPLFYAYLAASRARLYNHGGGDYNIQPPSEVIDTMYFC